MKRWFLFSALVLSSLFCREHVPEKIRVGANVWPGYEPLFAAKSLNFFKNDVRMVEYPSASEVLRAFRNNNLEMAALTLDEAIYLKADGFEIKIILVLDISSGGDAVLVQPEIKSAKELKGKKIGVEYTALGAYVLARFLEKHSIKIEEITLVPMEVDRHESAFLAREVDAVITFEPVKTKLLKKRARIIFDSSMIPGEIIDVLVVRRSLLKRSKDKKKIETVINAWYRSLEEIDANFSTMAELMFPHLQLTEKELKKTYEGLTLGSQKINNEMLHGPEPKIIPVIQKLSEIMKKNKIITGPISPQELL